MATEVDMKVLDIAAQIAEKDDDKTAAIEVLDKIDKANLSKAAQEEADFQARQGLTAVQRERVQLGFDPNEEIPEPVPVEIEVDEFSRQEDPLGQSVGFGRPVERDETFAPAPKKDIKMTPVWDNYTGAFIDRPEGWQGVSIPKDEQDERAEVAAIIKKSPDELSTLARMQGNIRDSAKLRVENAEFEFIEAQKLVEARENVDKNNADKLASDQADTEDAIADYERANAELTNLKVDPNQWYASRSTGQKILGALTIALSGYQRGMAGRGENTMLKAMNREIDKSTRIQLIEHKDKKAGVAGKKNLVSFYRDRLANDEQAVAAAKMKLNGDAKMRVLLFHSKNKGTQEGLNAERLLIDLDVQNARYQAEFNRASMKHQYAANKEDRQNRALNIGLIQNGRMLQADNPTDAIAARQVVSQRKEAISAIRDINKYLSEYDLVDWLNPSSQRKADMGAATTSLKASFRIMLVGPGTISDADRKLINEALPKLGGAWGSVSGKDLARYNAILDRFMKKTDENLETYTMNTDPTKVYQSSAVYQQRKSGPAPRGGK